MRPEPEPYPTRTAAEARPEHTRSLNEPSPERTSELFFLSSATTRGPDGRYSLANEGVEVTSGEIPRAAEFPVFPAIADSAFRLKPGEISLVPYDKRKCSWGWHVVKRVQ